MSVIGSNSTASPAPVLTPLSKQELKKRGLADFWKAARFLGPYRRLMIISIISAFFIGLATAGGLGTTFPLLRVLLSGDTVPNLVNEHIASTRLQVTFASQAGGENDLILSDVKDDGPAQAAGLIHGDRLAPTGSGIDATALLAQLADPQTQSIVLHPSPQRAVTIPNLQPAPWWFAYARPLVKHFPVKPVPAVSLVLLGCFLISVTGNIFGYFQNYYSDSAAILAINDIRRRLYDHVLHAPMAFFSSAGTSDVTSRLVGDCMGLQEGFKTILGQSIQLPINAAMAFGVALWFSWKLTLFIALFSPVLLIIIQKFGKKMRRTSRRTMQTSSSMLNQIVATLAGVRVVKGANAERFERRRYKAIMAGLTTQQLRMSRLDAISSPIVELSTTLVLCAVIVGATYLVRERAEISIEKCFVVLVCLFTVANAGQRMGKVYNSLQKSGAAATRIFQILDFGVERPRNLAAHNNRPRVPLKPIERDITIRDVSFAYPNTSSPALVDVNLTVAKGETVAIVGRNGSGKTTLLALLPRLFDPSAGTISIDGVNIQDATLKSLREQISVVTQDSVIFPLSIAENIAYGHPFSTRLKENIPPVIELRKRIESAARQAFAHDFILEKPQGYDTELVGLGGSLSGGQKQRLNIARAIFRQSPILILDEATSQVDAESEHLIQQAVESLMHDRTMFIIAHRLNTIKSADRIIVMDRGSIVAIGSHDELLNTSEAYNNLYERQLFAKPEEPPAAA